MSTLITLNPEFVSATLSILEEHCSKGLTMTRSEIVEKLGLVKNEDEVLISYAYKKNMFPGFECSVARGFTKIGVAVASKPNASKVEPEFVSSLLETLQKLVRPDAKVGVTRNAVAQEMGIPGSPTENKISLAFAAGLVPNYHTEKGPRGGIKFGPAPEKKNKKGGKTESPVEALVEPAAMITADGVTEEPEEKVETVETVEMTVEPVETTPEASVPAKSKKTKKSKKEQAQASA